MLKIIYFSILYLSYNIFSEPLPQNGKLTVAVVGGKGEVRSSIESGLVSLSFLQLVERTNMNKLLEEAKLGQQGVLKEGTYPRAGEILGAMYLVIVEKDSDSFKLVKSESARILGSWTTNSTDSIDELKGKLETESCIWEFITLQKKKKNKDIRLETLVVSAAKELGGAAFDEEITVEAKIFSKTFKEAYLTILVYTSDGNLIQLFPNKYQSDNKIPTNSEFKFPPTNASKKYKMYASPPAGEDVMIVIASDEAVQLPDDGSFYAGQYKAMTKKKVEGTKGVTLKLDKNAEIKYDVERVVMEIREKK